jgi:ribonuclease J
VIDCGHRIVDAFEDGARKRIVEHPDLEPVRAARDRLCGYVVTHGHDDHIGALPAATTIAPAPIYGTPFTLRRIRLRYRRDRAKLPELMVARTGTHRRVGPFDVRWLAVSHSIPDSAAVAVETSAGLLLHSGDFRVDEAPVLGPPTDLEALAALGDDGVAFLVADSTGAHVPGDNAGEASVRPGLQRAFETASGRLVIATFASHVQRIATIASLCRAHGRRLVLAGRGMRESVHAAEELGLLSIDDVVLREGDAWSVPPSSLCVAATGSQGEEYSALWRLAHDDHRITLGEGDRVVLSARVIPGNEDEVDDIVQRLQARGVEVLDGDEDRHVSGHGLSGDLMRLLSAARPRAFLAAHGEDRQIAAHRDLARAAGVAQIVEALDGDTIVLAGDGPPRVERPVG